jgi:exodeoxyribonuclease VII large subunit
MPRSSRSEALRFDFDALGAPEVIDHTAVQGREVPGEAGAGRAVPRGEAAERDPSEAAGAGTGPPDDAAASTGVTLSIAEFYDRVRAALVRALPGEVWVSGEIRKLNVSKGHLFLELADHDNGRGRPAQQLEVACWSKEWYRIEAELRRAGVSLETGRVVRVRGKVQLWEGASKLRLVMSALDVEALLGGIAVARQRLLRQLGEEGLLEANRGRELSLVPLRIGLVTSEGSEAHRDFTGRLDASGFAFELRVARTLVQGAQAPWQIDGALRRLGRGELDLIVIVRGGGGRGDLAAFDSEPVARAIATAPVPVWVGVGHSGDRSVADEVAHRCFSTPTACGDAVVARVEAYWSAVRRASGVLVHRASARLEVADDGLVRTRRFLARTAIHQLELRRADVDERRRQLAASVGRSLHAQAAELALEVERLERCGRAATVDEAHGVRRCRDVLRAYDPQRQLERGWSLTRDGAGHIVRSVAAVSTGELVRTTLADGELTSRVEASERPRAGGAGAAR